MIGKEILAMVTFMGSPLMWYSLQLLPIENDVTSHHLEWDQEKILPT